MSKTNEALKNPPTDEQLPQEQPAAKSNKFAPLPLLRASQLKSAELVRNHWVLEVPHGTTRAQLLDPAFWAPLAARLRVYDRIEIHTLDRTYWCELLVTVVGVKWAQVTPIGNTDISVPSEAVTSVNGLTVTWGGDELRYIVRRESDNVVLAQNIVTFNEGLAKAHELSLVHAPHKTPRAVHA